MSGPYFGELVTTMFPGHRSRSSQHKDLKFSWFCLGVMDAIANNLEPQSLINNAERHSDQLHNMHRAHVQNHTGVDDQRERFLVLGEQ